MASHILKSIGLRGVKRAYEEVELDPQDDTSLTPNKKKHRRSPLTISAVCAGKVLGAMITPVDTSVPIYRSFLNGSLFDKNLLRKILEYMSASQTTQVVETKSTLVPYRISSISVNPVNGDIWMIGGRRGTILVYTPDFDLKRHIEVDIDEHKFFVVRHFEDDVAFVTCGRSYHIHYHSEVHAITLLHSGRKRYDRRRLFGHYGISASQLAVIKDRNGLPLFALEHHDEERTIIYNQKGEVQQTFESGYNYCAVGRKIYMNADSSHQIIEYNLDTKEQTILDSKTTGRVSLISMGECMGVLNYDEHVLRIYRGSFLTNEIQLQLTQSSSFIDSRVNVAYCLFSRRMYCHTWDGMYYFVPAF